MKIELKDFFYLAGIIFLVWFFGCNKKQGTNTPIHDTVTTVTIIRKDSVIHEILTHNIYYSDTGKIILPVFIDSSAVVKDYFTQHPFTDSISNDSIDITYSGYIWKNSMFNPKLRYLWKLPQTTITNTTVQPAELRNKIYIGGFLSFKNEPAIGALVSVQDKRERILTIGYGTGPTYLLGAQWKLSFKKRE